MAPSLTFAADIRSANCARATVAPDPDSVAVFFSRISQSATNKRKSRVSCSRSGERCLVISVTWPPLWRGGSVCALLSIADSFSASRKRQQERHQRDDQEHDEQDLSD